MQESDRRRYFRIQDRVGLVVRPIPAADEEAAIAGFGGEQEPGCLLNELRALRASHLPERRSLEYKLPTVAAYVRVLEQQIDLLALALGSADGYAATPDRDVNISAQGLSFDGAETLTIGSLMEVKLTLFPDRSHIRALARVVRNAEERGGSIALDLTYLRDVDREAIVHHVHVLQRLRLQEQAAAQGDGPR